MDTGMFAGTMVITLIIVVLSVVVSLAVPVLIIVFMMKKSAERSRLVARASRRRPSSCRSRHRHADQQPAAAPDHARRAPRRAVSSRPSARRTRARSDDGDGARRPRTTVPVKLDPANPANLTIDWAAMGYMV